MLNPGWRALVVGAAVMAGIMPGSASATSATEKQLTFNPGGHVLTNLRTFSPDSKWVVFDERSDREGAEFDSRFIKRVNVDTGAVEVLYEAQNGAHVGVVTYNPQVDQVVFIHGPEFPTKDWSYAGDRREGSIVEATHPGKAVNLDARDITAPFTPGALRGGSHVHVYAADGRWLSFTYQDHVMNVLGTTEGHDLDQRNVGVSAPVRAVTVDRDSPRNRDGSTFTVLVTKTVNHPRPGSDEVNRAYEEGWVGDEGYLKPSGTRQRRAIAFLGDTVDLAGKKLTEVFVADIPEDITKAAPGHPLEGTATALPQPPLGTVQRRLTFTGTNKNPGVQGPRFWVRSSPDGSDLAFLMKDDAGIVQIFAVSPNGGAIRQITRNAFPVASTLSWSPDGKWLAYAADNSVLLTDAKTGETVRLTPKDASRPILALCVDFSPDGKRLSYERVVKTEGTDWNQIFVAELAD